MNIVLLGAMLDGARIGLCLVVALGFLRLGRRSADRLYYAFAIAFVLLAANWTLLGVGAASGDHSAAAFLPRLLAFLLIIAGIVDKNRRANR
ncbi:MAG TPA: DUF5985 family protein [Kofleriaceae bacterium]|jgi:hypothetical protein|nr:DUF5985 family protein [Kofleriaceae bacterium]